MRCKRCEKKIVKFTGDGVNYAYMHKKTGIVSCEMFATPKKKKKKSK